MFPARKNGSYKPTLFLKAKIVSKSQKCSYNPKQLVKIVLLSDYSPLAATVKCKNH